uniref:Craniofacial development protein 1 n=1 Tax=Parastrongyloides trichosuri TaxID=131310 RepID=A0A0N4ZJA2_PARTI
MSTTDLTVEEARDHSDIVLEEDLLSNSEDILDKIPSSDKIIDDDSDVVGETFDDIVEETADDIEEAADKIVVDKVHEDYVEEVSGPVTVMNINGGDSIDSRTEIIVSKVSVQKPADFPNYEEIKKAKEMENEENESKHTLRDPNVVKSGEPDNEDWAKKNIESGKKVNDLIARFNTGAIFKDSKEQVRSTYKSDYGVGKGQGQIRQSVFH